jgi:hypothetical protein
MFSEMIFHNILNTNPGRSANEFLSCEEKIFVKTLVFLRPVL